MVINGFIFPLYFFFYIFFTSEIFYVRNHLPVPDVKEDEYELEVEGVGVQELTMTLAALKKLPQYTVTAAIQCGGNRRSEMVQVGTHSLISN